MQNDTNKPVIWKPQPIEPPKIDSALSKLPPIERAAEILRYSVFKAEHWISPNGMLREWLRLNILAALVIGIPSVLLVPSVTYMLGHFASWMVFLAEAARNFVRFIGYALLAVAMISAAVMFFQSRRRH